MNVEVRTAALEQVDHAKREIDLIVVPWDEWATVEVAGRSIEESFAPGAFGQIDQAVQRGEPRFKVNLEHDLSREAWIGRVFRFDTDDPRGLHATVKVRRNAVGDQALDDAADGFYAASVGFASDPQHQEWSENRSRRRILKAFFDHVALTATPAYSGAAVLSVRTAPPASATPNLDAILAERRDAAYGAL